jgi:multiple sugar transport system permease protein
MVLLPAILLLLAFRIIPLFWGLLLSFTNFDGLGGADWVGAANYRSVLADPVFRDSLVNTLLVLATLPVWIMLPMLLAILIHQGVPGGRLFRAVYFLPAVLSSVIVGSIFNVVLRFDGSLNAAMKAVGSEPGGLAWPRLHGAGQPHRVHLWSTFGMSVLIFMAACPRSLRRCWKPRGSTGPVLAASRFIVIPTLRPIIEFVAVVTTIGLLTGMFGLIYVLTAGGPGTATTLPEFLIWLEQGKLNRPGYAAAISGVLFALMAGVAWMQVRIMSRNAEL